MVQRNCGKGWLDSTVVRPLLLPILLQLQKANSALRCHRCYWVGCLRAPLTLEAATPSTPPPVGENGDIELADAKSVENV
jgi:hypothetical protein